MYCDTLKEEEEKEEKTSNRISQKEGKKRFYEKNEDRHRAVVEKQQSEVKKINDITKQKKRNKIENPKNFRFNFVK